MSVLVTMLALTINVKAISYITDDSIVISSQFHDLFNNYFDGSRSYQYFPYTCNYENYDRTCYYGIDSDNNYLKITYSSLNNYSSSYKIETGVDENFAVTGSNIVKKSVDPLYIILYGFIFLFLVLFIFNLIF